jgi:UDP-N-acetylglucosamine acyltransferase
MDTGAAAGGMTGSGTRSGGPVVHPTAVVHRSAHLGDGVEIGPYAVIEADTVIGEGTVIGPHSVIHQGVTLGRRNRLAAHVVLGGRPQDRAYRDEPTRVVIGDDNLFSEFASVDRATGEGNETWIGNGTYIMSSTRISHNCRVGDGALIVSGVALGGWAEIGEHAYIGGLSGVHQFVRIGRMVMVAGLSGVRQDVPPYVMVAGFMARAVGLNRVGLARHGIPSADRLALRRAFRIFFRSGLPMDAAIAAIEPEAALSAPVQEFLAFIRAARARHRGIVRWGHESQP